MPVGSRKAFTLVEILVVIVILGILAAVAIPKFAGASEDAKASALQSTLGGVRSSIAAFRTAAVISGDDPYPTLAELTDGTTIKFEIPANPFTGVSGVQAVSLSQATNRTVLNESTAGWNYHVNNASDPPVVIFYANASEATTILDSDGNARGANEI